MSTSGVSPWHSPDGHARAPSRGGRQGRPAGSTAGREPDRSPCRGGRARTEPGQRPRRRCARVLLVCFRSWVGWLVPCPSAAEPAAQSWPPLSPPRHGRVPSVYVLRDAVGHDEASDGIGGGPRPDHPGGGGHRRVVVPVAQPLALWSRGAGFQSAAFAPHGPRPSARARGVVQVAPATPLADPHATGGTPVWVGGPGRGWARERHPSPRGRGSPTRIGVRIP